jgi:hypothetical protein
MFDSLRDVIEQRSKQVSEGINKIIGELPFTSADPDAIIGQLGASAAPGGLRGEERLKHSKSGQHLKSAGASAKSGSKIGQDADTDKSSAWNLVDVS